MFLSIKTLLHEHEWEEWEETNKHSWSHAITHYRRCRTCFKDEYRLIELLCPQLKIRGSYCNWCEPYLDEWNKRLANMEVLCDNLDMKKKQAKGRPVEEMARNISIVLEHDLYGKSFPFLMRKHKFKSTRTPYTIYIRSKKYINLDAVKEALC